MPYGPRSEFIGDVTEKPHRLVCLRPAGQIRRGNGRAGRSAPGGPRVRGKARLIASCVEQPDVRQRSGYVGECLEGPLERLLRRRVRSRRRYSCPSSNTIRSGFRIESASQVSSSMGPTVALLRWVESIDTRAQRRARDSWRPAVTMRSRIRLAVLELTDLEVRPAPGVARMKLPCG